MKIFVNQIPFEGLSLEEELKPQELDLDTEIAKFSAPVRMKGTASRITNAVSVSLNVKARVVISCSRCLRQFEKEINKDLTLNYPVDKGETFIDLNPDIREEIILDYPIKYLCSSGCKGLCAKCGKNLNEGGCNCALT